MICLMERRWWGMDGLRSRNKSLETKAIWRQVRSKTSMRKRQVHGMFTFSLLVSLKIKIYIYIHIYNLIETELSTLSLPRSLSPGTHSRTPTWGGRDLPTLKLQSWSWNQRWNLDIECWQPSQLLNCWAKLPPPWYLVILCSMNFLSLLKRHQEWKT